MADKPVPAPVVPDERSIDELLALPLPVYPDRPPYDPFKFYRCSCGRRFCGCV